MSGIVEGVIVDNLREEEVAANNGAHATTFVQQGVIEWDCGGYEGPALPSEQPFQQLPGRILSPSWNAVPRREVSRGLLFSTPVEDDGDDGSSTFQPRVRCCARVHECWQMPNWCVGQRAAITWFKCALVGWILGFSS